MYMHDMLLYMNTLKHGSLSYLHYPIPMPLIYYRYELEAVSKLLGGRSTLYSLREEEESEGSMYGDTHVYDVRVRQVPAMVQFEALDTVGCVYMSVCVLLYMLIICHDCRLIYTHLWRSYILYTPVY